MPASATATRVLVLSGPPGAGKSTVATEIANRWPLTVHLVADTFWQHIRSGYVLPWLPEAHHQNQVVMEAVAATTREFAAGGYHVVVDGIVGPWLLEPFVRRTDAGVDLHYVVLRPDLETTLARALSRGAEGLVEDQPLRHMYAEFSLLGDFERHVLNSSGWSVEATVDEVQRRVERGSHRIGA